MSSYTENINGRKYLIGEINAFQCKTISLLCEELEHIFQWSYIENINCIDAMFDLSWLEEKNYKIIVNSFSKLKSEKVKKMIVDELETYVEHWKTKKEQNEFENKFLVEYK